MALYEITKTYWHCSMCPYQTDRKPLSTKCTACGHDDVAPAYTDPRYNEFYFKGVVWLDKL